MAGNRGTGRGNARGGNDTKREPRSGGSVRSGPAKPKPPVASSEPAAGVIDAGTKVADMATAPAAIAAATNVEEVARVAEAQAVTVQQSVEKEVNTMASTVENTIETNQAKATAMFGEMNDRSKAAMEKSAKMLEEMNDFAKGNVEAIVESSRIAAKGMESIGQDAAEYTRKSFEHATSTMKSMASVKSPTELFKLQSDYMRSAFDMMVAETSKNTEQMMKLAGDAAQPLSNRVAVAANKAKIAA